MGKRELVDLLSLSSWCLMIVVWLFLLAPWVCLQFVIVIFRDYSYLLFFGDIHANSEASSEGSGESYLSLRLCIKSLVLPKMAKCVLFLPAANTLVSLHICADKIIGQCDKYQYLLC